MSKIVEIALKEVGYTETPKNTNKTKYGKWFGMDGLAWCGMFVSWCYDQAGQRLPNIGFSKGFADDKYYSSNSLDKVIEFINNNTK